MALIESMCQMSLVKSEQSRLRIMGILTDAVKKITKTYKILILITVS
jgi:hypothetical protein